MSEIDLNEKRASCPNCGIIQEVEEIHNKEHVTIKGKDVEFDSVSYKCKVCGKTFETIEQLDDNLTSAKKEYEKQELKLYDINNETGLNISYKIWAEPYNVLKEKLNLVEVPEYDDLGNHITEDDCISVFFEIDVNNKKHVFYICKRISIDVDFTPVHMMTEYLGWCSIKEIYKFMSFRVDDFYVLEKPELPIKYSEEEMHSKIHRTISYDSYIITKKDYPKIVSYITLEGKKELLSRCLKENLNGLETIKGTL